MRLMGVDKKITEIRQEQSQYISTMTNVSIPEECLLAMD